MTKATQQSLCSITHKGQPVEMSKATHVYLDYSFREFLDYETHANNYIYEGHINPHFRFVKEDDIKGFITGNADLMGEFEKSLSSRNLVEEIYNEVVRLNGITEQGDIQVSWDFEIDEDGNYIYPNV